MILRYALACLILISSHVMAIEEPRYELVLAQEDFQLRRYSPMLIAQVTVSGDLSTASNRGFRQVADFIFGANEDPIKKEAQKIAMTAPVVIEDVSSKIAMTAPVIVQTESGPGQSSKEALWKLAFVMPRQFMLENLPRPKNPNIEIQKLAEREVAVVTFSGWVSEADYQKQTERLRTWIQQQGWRTAGEPQLSRYNPPWTLPFWRRNEVWLPITRQ